MVRKTFKMRVSRNRTISINGSILDVDVTHDEFYKSLLSGSILKVGRLWG